MAYDQQNYQTQSLGQTGPAGGGLDYGQGLGLAAQSRQWQGRVDSAPMLEIPVTQRLANVAERMESASSRLHGLLERVRGPVPEPAECNSAKATGLSPAVAPLDRSLSVAEQILAVIEHRLAELENRL